MKIRKIHPTIFGLLSLSLILFLSLSCNYVTQAFTLVTPTPLPSATPLPSSTPVSTPTPSPTPLTEGLYIPDECRGPVSTLAPRVSYASPTPVAEDKNPELTKKQQLEVFTELTKSVSQEYLYPDFNGVDWVGLVAKTREKIKAGLTTSAYYLEMENLVQALNDEHSQFQSPSEVTRVDEELSGHSDFVGIGVLIETLIEKKVMTIVAVYPNSPAEHAGLKAHDSLLTVDGLPLVENGESNNWRVRGPQCSALVLTVQSPGGDVRQVMLLRNRITSSLKVDARLVKTKDGARIGYIFLPSFFDETIPPQVLTALQQFGQLDGLILDNRQNGGGASDLFEPIIAFFAHGNLGSYITRKESIPLEIRAHPVHNSQEIPLVVLVGENTVSYGEIFSGILQDIGRAKIVGVTTLGNVEVLISKTFSDGSRAWIAEERFDPPVSHANWEKDGIKPDVQAFADWNTFTFDTDPAIIAALKLLGHQ